MASEFDKLEEEIMADMWSAYTKTVIDHALNPRNVGSMADADGFGRVTGPWKGATCQQGCGARRSRSVAPA